jgi:small subunit ribosomal protein S16
MVILRLQRIGRKKSPHFRLIAQDKKKDQWDKSIEILGWKNPRSKEKSLKKDRIEYWLSVGAQCTDTVHNWLINEGIIKEDKKRKSIKISKKRKEKIADKKKVAEEKAVADTAAKETAPVADNTPVETTEEVAPEVVPVVEEQSVETPVEDKKE